MESCVAPRRFRCADESADSSTDGEPPETVVGPGKCVDTDDEASAGSLGLSSSGDAFIEQYVLPIPLKPAAATGAKASEAAATGASRVRRAGHEPWWSDPYFIVWGHPNVDFVRMVMRDMWRAQSPEGMGATNCSKQLTPRHFGEPVEDPTITLLLLRAWAIWRARQNGWASLQRGRARHFKEQEVLLEHDINALSSPTWGLGHKKANVILAGLAPDLAARLRQTGRAATGMAATGAAA